MQSKAISILAVAIIFACSLVIFSNEVKAYTSHSPIYIDGNSGFNSTNGVSSGNGTEENPYIIENWDINASSDNGIEIRNTDKYFIIRNCYVHDGGSNYDGIYFYNAINGSIENCEIKNNNDGILLSSSSNNNMINDNNIYNNWNGIYLYSSNNNVNDNNVHHNENGIYIYYSSNNSINNNDIYSNNWRGVSLSGSVNKITKNNVSNNSYGIYLKSSSNSVIENCTILNSTNYDIFSWASNDTAINTTFSTIFVDGPSQLIIKNYLEVLVQDNNSNPIPNATVSVKDNGNEVFNGTTNSDGLISWILITDRIYQGSSSATENTTTVQVWYDNFTFSDNPRNVNMSNSHRETFQSNEAIPEFNSFIIPIFIMIALFISMRKFRNRNI